MKKSKSSNSLTQDSTIEISESQFGDDVSMVGQSIQMGHFSESGRSLNIAPNIDSNETDLLNCLEYIHTWNFDIFRFV